MAEYTPPSSQENALPTNRLALHGQELGSSPILPTVGNQKSSKQRKAPTITPRTFTRFFTPKSSLERGGRISASRQALRDITASASNRTGRTALEKDALQTEVHSFPSKKRKRRVPDSPNILCDQSSPLKRIRHQSIAISDDEDLDIDAILSEDNAGAAPDQPRHHDHASSKSVERITVSRYRSVLGQTLQREIGSYIRKAGHIDSDRGLCKSKPWQYETASFSTRPEDGHCCTNIGSPSERSIPFCTASCKRNSLVAIGDEDGGIRLLESDQNQNPPFSKAFLTFRPHANAILDLDFSPDDMLLATASGDQTAQIIDMPRQLATYSLAGHYSSIKQVRFQPESSSVVATSSRDGNVQIWDLRCKGFDGPVRDIVRVSLDPTATRVPQNNKLTWARSVNTIVQTHASCEPLTPTSDFSKTGLHADIPSRSDPPPRRGDVSVTALSFLTPDRPHLLLTGSEVDACVRLWDLRTTHNARRQARSTPLCSTRQPGSHTKHRHFGLTSLSLSGDGGRLYTLCRDNTVYAYSTSHLILGHAPELSNPAPRARRSGGPEREGLGPLYGFRHPKFHATTFYVKSALRPASDNKSEMLAVGSSDGCAVLFPTDERYLHHSSCQHDNEDAGRSQRPNLRRASSGMHLGGRLEDTIPIYQHGSALVRGHTREVTSLSWTTGGDLVSVGDDYMSRCWREGEGARELRVGGEKEGKRWGCGWAEVDGEWDDDDE